MSNAQKEELIIKLNDERKRLIKLLKGAKHQEYEKKYKKRIEEINQEIEDIIYG